MFQQRLLLAVMHRLGTGGGTGCGGSTGVAKRTTHRSLQQRREAHQRIRQAEDGLELSIASLEAQQTQQKTLAQHLAREVDRLSLQANAPPAPDRASHLQLVPWLPTQPERNAA